MNDLKMQSTTGDLKDCDLLVIDGDLAVDDGLYGDTLVSLFTDRIALDDDTPPDGTDDRRGYWADSYSDKNIGSRLWLLHRDKVLPKTMLLTEEYALEALQWFKDEGAASQILADAERHEIYGIGLNTQILESDNQEWRETWRTHAND